jgi:hypothetical protein
MWECLLSPTLFAMLVIMAVITTLATMPVLQTLAITPEAIAAEQPI